LYFLLADLDIRERTRGRRSLDDAIRAVRRTGATVEARWSLDRVLEAGDAATGTPVLHELYRRFGRAPAMVDLPALFARMGIARVGSRLRFDDRAPLGRYRAAITAVLPGGDLR